MARRLLGADSATVFNIQEPEEETANQVLCSSGLLRKTTITRFLWAPFLGSILWKVEGRSKKSIILFIFIEHVLYARHCIK